VFEEYLQDSFAFVNKARELSAEGDERNSKRYYRAAIFYSISSIEAYINFLADTFEKGQSLTEHEIAFLSDKKFVFSPSRFQVEDQTEYHKLQEKLKFVIKRFLPEYDVNTPEWSYLIELKDLRDRLVHPKTHEDTILLEDYERVLTRGLMGGIKIMNEISIGVFNKPLRKKLIDLIPN
jgi:hypothetical protein